MKHTHFKASLYALAITATLFLTDCKRSDKDKDNDTEIAGDNALSESSYNDVLNIADDASDKSTGDNLSNYKTASNCATVTHDTFSTPRTITIDFGAVNCLCNDGRYRRGKILVSYSGHYRDSGSVHTITFDSYFVNDRHIMGSKTVTNMGHNTAGHSYFSIVVNGLIVKPSGDSISWNSNRTRTWTQGESTPGKMDDVYEITGSASGTKGTTSYTMLITQPLVRSLDCNWIQSGTFELQPSGKPLRTFDFGNGTCDNTATVTINGTVYTITLP
ncbi:hypothetical protein EMGBS15_05990 [Filimonas sp.]|nr:hypothetical protein EMGBS15_05990 [Filimonas sp.]